MISTRAKSSFDASRVKRAARNGSFRSLEHAAASIRLTAQRSIRPSRKPAPAGTPPHTRGNRRLKNAIKYAVAKTYSGDSVSAVIGPDVAVAGDVGKAHEFGGKYRDEHYDKRPFMGPALDKNAGKLADMWAGSVK